MLKFGNGNAVVECGMERRLNAIRRESCSWPGSILVLITQTELLGHQLQVKLCDEQAA
jgi:hypothetical protein